MQAYVRNKLDDAIRCSLSREMDSIISSCQTHFVKLSMDDIEWLSEAIQYYKSEFGKSAALLEAKFALVKAYITEISACQGTVE